METLGFWAANYFFDFIWYRLKTIDNIAMKLLDVSSLAELSNYLSVDMDDTRLDVHLEAYSCKMVGEEKKAFKHLYEGTSVDELEQLSPSPALISRARSASGSDSSFTPQDLQFKCSRRTLYYLKATLNAVFSPDYDFSGAKSHEFSKEPSVEWAQRNITANMRLALRDEFDRISTTLWNRMDETIHFQDCDVYSYNPDLDSDPFGSQGCLWCFNYFWYNKKLKRILFFRARSSSLRASSFEDDAYGYDDDDDGMVMDMDM